MKHSMQELTPKQRETLRVVRDMTKRHGLPPTLRELCVVLGITRNAVRERLAQLAVKGYVVLMPKLARGIVVVDR